MSDQIDASFTTLFEQAKDTATSYLRAACREIDDELGEGYAKKHPELIAAFMHTAITDFNTTTNAKVQGAALNKIAYSLELIADNLEQ